MNFESARIALQGINANRLRSVLTMLGIMIGVAAVIILVAVGSGSAAANRKRLEALGSNTLTVLPGGFGQGARGGTQSRRVQITDGDVAALADPTQAPSISAVVPSVRIANVVVSYNGASTTPAQELGTTASFAPVRNYPVKTGSFITADDEDNHSRVVVLGTSVAKNLLGDATADPSSMLGATVQVGAGQYTVIGTFESKGSNGAQDQDDIIVMPMSTARDALVGNTGTVDGLTVQAKNRAATDTAQNEITSILAARHRTTTTSSFQVLNQASLLATQDASNRTFTVLLGTVAAISLLVGGIGVMNIMLVTVTERTREIGIRKAIGAQRSHILGQFMVEAVLLTMLGGLLGVVVGLLGSQFTIVGVEPIVAPYSIVLAFGVAVLIGLFFGIYPANRAASLRPIDALRYE